MVGLQAKYGTKQLHLLARSRGGRDFEDEAFEASGRQIDGSRQVGRWGREFLYFKLLPHGCAEWVPEETLVPWRIAYDNPP
jgi:hypothetical protein